MWLSTVEIIDSTYGRRLSNHTEVERPSCRTCTKTEDKQRDFRSVKTGTKKKKKVSKSLKQQVNLPLEHVKLLCLQRSFSISVDPCGSPYRTLPVSVFEAVYRL